MRRTVRRAMCVTARRWEHPRAQTTQTLARHLRSASGFSIWDARRAGSAALARALHNSVSGSMCSDAIMRRTNMEEFVRMIVIVELLRGVPGGCAAPVYIDPPFDTGRGCAGNPSERRSP